MKGITTVANIRTDESLIRNAIKHGRYERIDRASKWGNPFSHKAGTKAQFIVSSREESISRYEEWIQGQQHLLDSIHELQGKVLGCWCQPLPCHGNVLLKLVAEWEADQALLDKYLDYIYAKD